MEKVCENLTPVAVIVFATFLLYITLLKIKTTEHKLVFWILLVDVIIEFFSALMLALNLNYVPIYNIGFYLHNVLWLALLIKVMEWKKWGYYVLIFYAVFAVSDSCFSPISLLNVKGFIFGGMLYILLFILAIYSKLKSEDFLFFYKNQFIIISVPIMFFFGLCITLAFDSQVRKIVIYKEYSLYDLINNFVNIIYYSLLLIYIKKERKFNR